MSEVDNLKLRAEVGYLLLRLSKYEDYVGDLIQQIAEKQLMDEIDILRERPGGPYSSHLTSIIKFVLDVDQLQGSLHANFDQIHVFLNEYNHK